MASVGEGRGGQTAIVLYETGLRIKNSRRGNVISSEYKRIVFSRDSDLTTTNICPLVR